MAGKRISHQSNQNFPWWVSYKMRNHAALAVHEIWGALKMKRNTTGCQDWPIFMCCGQAWKMWRKGCTNRNQESFVLGFLTLSQFVYAWNNSRSILRAFFCESLKYLVGKLSEPITSLGVYISHTTAKSNLREKHHRFTLSRQHSFRVWHTHANYAPLVCAAASISRLGCFSENYHLVIRVGGGAQRSQ